MKERSEEERMYRAERRVRGLRVAALCVATALAGAACVAFALWRAMV